MTIIRDVAYVLAAGVLVVAFIALVMTISAYVGPRLQRISRGDRHPQGLKECCPPGLGCNDPDKDSRKCLRVEARRIGKMDELTRLERSWSEFCGVPRRQKKERLKAMMAYAAARDSIISRSLAEVADQVDARRADLTPRHLQLDGVNRPALNQVNHNEPEPQSQAVQGHLVYDPDPRGF